MHLCKPWVIIFAHCTYSQGNRDLQTYSMGTQSENNQKFGQQSGSNSMYFAKKHN